MPHEAHESLGEILERGRKISARLQGAQGASQKVQNGYVKRQILSIFMAFSCEKTPILGYIIKTKKTLREDKEV
jgi:hypothetical protein